MCRCVCADVQMYVFNACVHLIFVHMLHGSPVDHRTTLRNPSTVYIPGTELSLPGLCGKHINSLSYFASLGAFILPNCLSREGAQQSLPTSQDLYSHGHPVGLTS